MEDRFPRVYFDDARRTFSLYSGESLYAFCITPELSLEHLYWGPSLSRKYDLRYLSQNTRRLHFNTVEKDEFYGDEEYCDVKTKELHAAMEQKLKDNTNYIDEAHLERFNNLNDRLRAIAERKNRMSAAQGHTADAIARDCLGEHATAHKETDDCLAPELGFGRDSGAIGNGSISLEYSGSGSGDFRSPSFIAMCPSSCCLTPLLYQSHTIMAGKVTTAAIDDSLGTTEGRCCEWWNC